MFRQIIIFFILISSVLLYSFELVYIEETPETTEFEVRIPELEIVPAGDFISVDFARSSHSSEAGSPDIPYLKFFFAVPKNGSLTASVIETGRESVSLEKALRPVERPSQVHDLASDYIIDEAKYRSGKRSFEVLPMQTHNVYDLIPVVAYPVQYDFEQGILTYHRNIRIRVTISGDFPQNISAITDSKSAVKGLITNSKYGLNFMQTRDNEFNTSGFGRSHSWYRIDVNSDGMYMLDYQFLRALPIGDIDPSTIRIFSTGGMTINPAAADPGHSFAEVPLLLIGGEDGNFGVNDKIIFYAQQRDGYGRNAPLGIYGGYNPVNDYHFQNPYSKQGHYWLTWGGDFATPPKRMQNETYQSSELTRSSGRIQTHYENLNANIRNDPYSMDWYTQKLYNNVPVNYTANLEDLDTSLSQKFDIIFAATSAGTNNDTYQHSLKVSAGSREIFTRYFAGTNPTRETRTGQYFVEGSNIIKLEVSRSPNSPCEKLFKSYHVDWFKKLYKRGSALAFWGNVGDQNRLVRYDFTKVGNQNIRIFRVAPDRSTSVLTENDGYFIAPTSAETQFYIVSEGEYLSPQSITKITPAILDEDIPVHDIVIISPKALIEGARRLQSIYTEKQGYQAFVVELDDVLNNFSGGHPDPTAIRNYLQYIQFRYTEKTGQAELPAGAVLIGTGTLDIRNYSGVAAAKNQMFVYQRDVGGGRVMTCDDFYANMTLTNPDKPEIVVGRVPVMNMTEFNNYLDKLDEYLRNPNPGWWQFTLQIIADDHISAGDFSEAYHTNQAENYGNKVAGNIIVDKIFAIEYELGADKKKPQVRDLLVSKINEGRLYWIYQGHGSERNNGDEGYFNASTDIPLLNNRGKYPIFIAGACDSGQYQSITVRTLAEELLIAKNKGSIISMAATGKSTPGSNYTLFSNYLEQAINLDYLPGEALMLAKSISPQSNNTFYSVLGDPFLRVVKPKRSENLRFLPTGDDDSEPEILYIGQTVFAEGSFDDHITADYVSNLVYDSGFAKTTQILSIPITNENLPIFNGKSSISGDTNYSIGFVIPNDTAIGLKSKIYSMAIDKTNNTTYVNKRSNIRISDAVYFPPADTLSPSLDLYIDSFDFREGDTVQPFPNLIARITSANGLNTIGAPGHHMMIIPNNSKDVIFATSGFEYDLDSYTTGTLTWKMTNLPTGRNDVKLAVYDSFNKISTADTWFVTSALVKLKISKPLVYPNPMKRNGGDFTFELSHDATVSFSIYTITGRKIYSRSHVNAYRGFNCDVLSWDGRDADGHKIANGTYFYKIRAVAKEGKGSTEITDKFIMLQ
ncbi:MAG: C25 family cysteine peptidase [Candidatus Cloacimonetes bacterium]|nr:C25 family cysteine peptidase [Candidatus Cloacimonadota bacterium]